MSFRDTLKSYLFAWTQRENGGERICTGNWFISYASIRCCGSGECDSRNMVAIKVNIWTVLSLKTIKLHYAQAFYLTQIGCLKRSYLLITVNECVVKHWTHRIWNRQCENMKTCIIRSTHVWIGKQKPQSSSYIQCAMFLLEILRKFDFKLSSERFHGLRCEMKIAKWFFRARVD